MSDPSSINSALNTRIDSNARNSSERQSNASLVEIPETLKDTDRPERVRGKVTRIDRDGTATIQTDRGDIKAKIDAKTSIESGDTVEIRIDRGNPPQTAYIKPTPKNTQIQTPPQQPQSNVTLPPPITVQELINGAPLQVTHTPKEQISALTQPFVETINNNVIAVSDLTVKPVLLDTTTTNLNSAPIQLDAPTRVFDTPKIIATHPEATQTQTPITTQNDQITTFLTPIPPSSINVPFRTIAPQIIAAPLQAPITTQTQAPTAQSVISDIQIQTITPPAPIITAPQSEGAPPPPQTPQTNDRAGETRSVLVGYTPDKNFPVIELVTPQSDTRPLHYTLQTPIIEGEIPIGSRIELNILNTTTHNVSPTAQNLITAQLPVLNTAYYLTPQAWPILQDIQNNLIINAPQTAQAMSAVIPNAANPQQLGNAVMFFVAAMRSGDMQGWLGDRASDVLKKAGKGDLLSRLGREMSGLLRLNSEPISQDWRALSVPLGWQDDVHKMVLYYRKEDQSGGSDDAMKGTKTRFIMNLNLSQMGKVQLDALFIGQSQGIGRLDLVLRTEDNFSGAMKQQMREGYKNALQETQITGELSFQGALNSWVHITPDSAQEYEANI